MKFYQAVEVNIMEKSDLDFSHENIAEFCRRNHIRKLSVFGSFLRDDYNEDSDVDILVEFSPDHIPGLIRLAGMENELSSALGRKVDIRTAEDLSRYFRNEVLESAEVKYVEG
jgi:predicted nucleotidyltransferase